MTCIRPTARGWTLALAAGGCCLVGLVNDAAFPIVFACCLGAVVAISLVAACLSLWGIRLERGPLGDAATGQAVSMPLRVINQRHRRRQPFLVLEHCPFALEKQHATLVAGLKASEERLVPRRVLAMHRGEFELDGVTLRGGDPAGLFLRSRYVSLPRKILVLPGVEPVPELRLRRERAVGAITGQPVSAAGTSQEFYGVREYNPTDGLRYIHWKNSARFGKLMVREFERNSVMSVAVLLDAYQHFVSGPEHWSNLEYQVRAAASITSHVAGLFCQLAFGAGGSQRRIVTPKLAATAEVEILCELARLQPGNVPLHDVVYELGERLPRATVVFCLSLAATRPVADALEALTRQGMAVRWLCAPKQAFQETGLWRKPRAAQAPCSPFPVQPTQLRPGTRLGQVLPHP